MADPVSAPAGIQASKAEESFRALAQGVLTGWLLAGMGALPMAA